MLFNLLAFHLSSDQLVVWTSRFSSGQQYNAFSNLHSPACLLLYFCTFLVARMACKSQLEDHNLCITSHGSSFTPLISTVYAFYSWMTVNIFHNFKPSFKCIPLCLAEFAEPRKCRQLKSRKHNESVVNANLELFHICSCCCCCGCTFKVCKHKK